MSRTRERGARPRAAAPPPGAGAPEAAPSTHRVRKPSPSSSARKTSPTARTPAKFMVPLLMFTTRSSSATDAVAVRVDGRASLRARWRRARPRRRRSPGPASARRSRSAPWRIRPPRTGRGAAGQLAAGGGDVAPARPAHDAADAARTARPLWNRRTTSSEGGRRPEAGNALWGMRFTCASSPSSSAASRATSSSLSFTPVPQHVLDEGAAAGVQGLVLAQRAEQRGDRPGPVVRHQRAGAGRRWWRSATGRGGRAPRAGSASSPGARPEVETVTCAAREPRPRGFEQAVDGLQHRVEVVHRLAHPHEHHVARRGSRGRIRGRHRVLEQDLARVERAHEAQGGGRAEGAGARAAGLAGDADRAAARGRE